jgi:hypothetical protein
MFENLALLKPAEHGGLRLSPTHDYRFAARELLVPIVFSELADIAREYPLLFVENQALPCALLGFEQGANAYVGRDDGRWLAQYIPGRIRAYPFTLVRNPDQPDQFGMAVDIAAPTISSTTGEPLFVGDRPSPALSGVLKLLEELQKAEATTRHLVRMIRDADLLVSRVVQIKKGGPQDTRLTGLEFIDEKKLNQLPHDAFNRLRDGGVLPLIYAHLLSFANLRRGPLHGHQPRPEADDLGFAINDSETIRFH